MAAQESDNPENPDADGEDVQDQDVEPEKTTALAVPPKGEIAQQPQIAQPMLRPQPGGARPSFVYFTSYTDYTARIQALMAALDQSFDRGDYLYAIDVNAYWKRRTQLDDIFDWVVSQIQKDPILEGRVPALVLQYDSIEDAAEDRDDEIRKKARYVGAVLGESGLALKEKKPGFKAVPSEAMALQIRQDLEPWQLRPEEIGVIQISQILVEAIRKRRLCIMLIDASPFMDSPYGGGKSQLLWQVLYWAYRQLDHVFDPRKDIVYRRDRPRFKRLLAGTEAVPFGVDEIDQFTDKREWYLATNKEIVQELQMYRKARRPIVGACGSIWNEDERMRHKLITHRIEIQEWDDDSYVGKFSVFRKWGPPKLQKEEEDSWGKEFMAGGFNGLTRQQFRFYNSCADTTRDREEKGGLDKQLTDDPDWLADLVPAINPALTEGSDPIDWDPRDEEDSPRNSGD